MEQPRFWKKRYGIPAKPSLEAKALGLRIKCELDKRYFVSNDLEFSAGYFLKAYPGEPTRLRSALRNLNAINCTLH